MDGRLQVFSGNSHPQLAADIMRELEAPLGRAHVGTWQNGETRIKLDENVRGSDVFVIQSICEPVNQHLMELLLLIGVAAAVYFLALKLLHCLALGEILAELRRKERRNRDD